MSCSIILKVNVPSSSSRHLPALALALVALALAACTTQRLYEGPHLSDAERAVVRADPVVSAGLPVSIRLRRVDAHEVSMSSRSVALAPGAHSFLVDCRVEESGSVRRFVVEGEVEAGGRYRFVANASTRNCEAVELIRD
jgi:hypothetical protein